MTYKVLGPDPDGDYFILEIVDGEERVLDESFDSAEDAQAAIERMERTAGIEPSNISLED